jgi:copper ion binding protein
MKTKLTIAGMHCEHCVKAVEGALSALSGVKKVKVNLKKGLGEVEHAESVPLDAMKAAVVEAGFTAT